MDKSRETALKVLVKIDKDGAFSNIALKDELSKNKKLTRQDRYFITNLVYGVVDKLLTLDYVISNLSRIKLKKISVWILNILRLGIYQIMFMDKVPESAAVNESVNLAKRYGHGASKGFVNGVLRSATRYEIEYPDDKLEYLSVKYSYPMWLCEKFVNDFGYEFCEDLMIAFSKSPRLTLRVNTINSDIDTVFNALSEYNPEIFEDAIVCDGFDVSDNELYKKGYISVQDISAQTAGKVLAPKKGETVIDMCAAPGGKTTQLAEIMENEGRIYAFDMYEHKIDLINKNAKRLGIDIIDAKCQDATVLNNELIGTADKILCDVPCSGLGIIGRKPEIKWNRQEDLDSLLSVQAKILENASRYVKPDGVIVYSTCTINKDENEKITDAFLKEHGEFKKTYEKTFYPNIDRGDGFYICRFEKNSRCISHALNA